MAANASKSVQTVKELTALESISTPTIDLTTVSFTSRNEIRKNAMKINPTESNLFNHPTLVEQAATLALTT